MSTRTRTVFVAARRRAVSPHAARRHRGSRRCARTLDAYADAVQHQVGGVVRLKLFERRLRASSDVDVAPATKNDRVLAKARLDHRRDDDDPTDD